MAEAKFEQHRTCIKNEHQIENLAAKILLVGFVGWILPIVKIKQKGNKRNQIKMWN